MAVSQVPRSSLLHTDQPSDSVLIEIICLATSYPELHRNFKQGSDEQPRYLLVTRYNPKGCLAFHSSCLQIDMELVFAKLWE
ncbi:hypothetical protein Trydic_g5333 [Trypoxylus dichotomus]